MATSDRISGSYYLDTYSGNVTITSDGGKGEIFLYGNLWVFGSFSNVKSVETLIDDNIITLSANTQGVPVLNSGIYVKRGIEPTVGLRWTENIRHWQVTNDGTYWSNIMAHVEDDSDPHLGGHLYTTGMIYSNTNWEIRSIYPHNIKLTPGWDGLRGNTALQVSHNHVSSSIAYVPNSTVLYAKTPGRGESGLYITNEAQRSEELITKRKALIYSLVL